MTTPDRPADVAALTEAEREALIEAIQNGTQDEWVDAIIAARVAAAAPTLATVRADAGRHWLLALADDENAAGDIAAAMVFGTNELSRTQRGLRALAEAVGDDHA